MSNKKHTLATRERAEEVLSYALLHGDDQAVKDLDVNHETLARYRRLYPEARRDLLAKVTAACTEEELKLMAKAGPAPIKATHVADRFTGEEYAFGFVTDLHVGHSCYRPEWWRAAVAELKRQKINRLFLGGDITEGMSHRPGQIYELTHLGFARQKDYAVEELALFDGEVYAIDGNHDRWFQKSNGAVIVRDICEALPHAVFLGQDEGDVVVNGVKIRLFHGEDGASYAISYRIQKLVESITGGEKPNVLLLGHDHKSIFLPQERNIVCVGGGTLEAQTPWMRATRKAAHPGFWILRLVLGKGEVKSTTATFHNFFK